MRDLLEFIVKNILGETSKFEVTEKEEDGLVTLIIKTEPNAGGLIIGKQGKIIKAIRNILKIKAVLQRKKVNLLVNPEN